MEFVNHLNFFGVEAKEIPTITGKGIPTESTQGAVGCLYMDTLTGHMYKCTSVQAGKYTWVTSADQTYNPTSENAQSGKAVTEAIDAVKDYVDNKNTANIQIITWEEND